MMFVNLRGAKMIPLSETIRNAINDRLKQVNTILPAIIESYDPEKKTASVTPAAQKKAPDGSIIEPQTLELVPVVFPGSSVAQISFPLEKGDMVLLACAQRSIDNLLESMTSYDPDDTRMHDINDAVILAGMFAQPVFSHGISIEPNAIKVKSHSEENGTEASTTFEADSINIKTGNTTVACKDDGIDIAAGNASIKIDSQGSISITGTSIKISGLNEHFQAFKNFLLALQTASAAAPLTPINGVAAKGLAELETITSLNPAPPG